MPSSVLSTFRSLGRDQWRALGLKAPAPHEIRQAVWRYVQPAWSHYRERGGGELLAQMATLETEICGQRLWARRAEKGPLNPRNPAERPVPSAQATEMSGYFRPGEITSIRADCLVELRGFKLANHRRCVREREAFSRRV